MLKGNLQNEEFLLRRSAAGGQFEVVQKILDRNKPGDVNFFNVNSGSSNGNTALHWACSKVMEKSKGYSSEYSQIIQSLVRYGADHLKENNAGKRPRDFFIEGSDSGAINSFTIGGTIKDSSYLALIQALLEKECMKITSPEELQGELAIATSFYLIIDGLKLVDFFPPETKQKDTFTLLSLACGLSTEILPLMLYFQYQNKKVNYVGIDTNRHVIEDSKARYQAYENVDFICADASNLAEVSAITSLYPIDMGMLRNGDFTEQNGRRGAFCKMINRVLPNLLKPNYPVLITFQTKYELDVCIKKTQLNLNFKKFKSNNFCDTGKLCFFLSQDEDDTVVTYPDRFSVILNADKTSYDQDQLSHRLQK